MAIEINDLIWDKNQGLTEQDRAFGYIHTGNEEGGYFFTWMPTLEETLASINADEQDEPTFGESLAKEFLRGKLADHFSAEG